RGSRMGGDRRRRAIRRGPGAHHVELHGQRRRPGRGQPLRAHLPAGMTGDTPIERSARPRLAVLASHEGTILQAVIDACARGALRWDIGVVVSNNPESGALRRAREAGLPARHLSSRTHEAADALDAAIRRTLVEHRTHLVLLAGDMTKLGPLTLA